MRHAIIALSGATPDIHTSCKAVGVSMMTNSVPARIPPITPGEFNLAALPALLQTESPIILEVGSHNGYHTSHFLRLFPAGRVFAFEPDKRAQQAFRENVGDPRAILFHVAIGAADGVTTFYPSSGVNPESNDRHCGDWDHSGSIREPTGHLVKHPWCTFPGAQAVRMRMLDTVVQELGIETVDFVWADVQGAEADLIRGGSAALARTRYIHTEYSDNELYRGQLGLSSLLELLPDFQVLVRWHNDVLLWNTSFQPPPPALTGSIPLRPQQATSLPPPPYVLARPCTGLNDTLCELEKCLRYCEATGRHLVVDTTRSGLFEQLDVYLESRLPVPMTLRCTESEVRRLNSLATVPNVISGRLDTYDSQYAGQIGKWVESTTLEPISFDFSTLHAEPLLVHEQHWTGPLLSPAFLARCRFTHPVATEVTRRLKTMPSNDYFAVHVRNTDYTTNYSKFFEQIRSHVSGMPVLICTDDSRVFDRAVRAFPNSCVFRLSTFTNEDGRPLHGSRHDNQHEINIQTLTDLMALALSREILSADVQQIPRRSGFTLLAMALQQEKAIVQGLFSEPS